MILYLPNWSHFRHLKQHIDIYTHVRYIFAVYNIWNVYFPWLIVNTYVEFLDRYHYFYQNVQF